VCGAGRLAGAAADANPQSLLAQIDFTEVIFLHQLNEPANALDFQHAVGIGLGLIHRGGPGFRRRRPLAGGPSGAGFIAVGHVLKDETGRMKDERLVWK
jgi:hypothetical protein